MLPRRSSVRLILLIGFYFIYLIIGAYIFSAIEAPEEADRIKQLRNFRSKFLKYHECLRGDSTLILRLNRTFIFAHSSDEFCPRLVRNFLKSQLNEFPV
ncbi:hypothetical protein V9T40_007231 [Parthenolecanium corni]|uniref:Uncharacterized protein n=1 Tax=Parthenolecanium corni TaxID=536013 RepID=A0AAN9Y9M1_9HEMI